LAHGEGVSKNVVEAAQYFKLSADQGNVDAQFNYGLALKKGTGVSENRVEAATYFRLSADQGNAQARAKLNT
jgi:TPR repeat protein